MKTSHKSQKVTNSLFFRSLYLYNSLEIEVRNLNPKKMSKYLQENIKYIFPFNKIPKNIWYFKKLYQSVKLNKHQAMCTCIEPFTCI